MSERSLGARLRRLGPRARALRALSLLDRDQLNALETLARTVTEEHVVPRRSPTIAASAVIHPSATLRFVDRVEIGDGASIGPGCCVWGGWSRTWARIGERALLSPGVVVVAGNHDTTGTGAIKDQGFIELDASIGAGAWVGAHAVIVGCNVGEGAVVGAGSVVTIDIPAYAIAVGSPARVVGHRS
jgi:acetyltransferase-like isoleucine patch superfamily enzyme